MVQCALGGENGEGGDFAEEIIRGIEVGVLGLGGYLFLARNTFALSHVL